MAAEDMQAWLERFTQALDAGTTSRALLFAATATGAIFWPSPGRSRRWRADRVRAMLRDAGHRRPRGGGSPGALVDEEGLTEAWFAFDTALGPGRASCGSTAATAATSTPRLPTSMATRNRPARAARWAWTTARAGIARPGRRPARRDEAMGVGAALLPGHRRRPGRHHAGRAAEAARRAHRDRREECAGRRFLAQPLPLARAARSGLVRPSALHPVSRQLAGLHAQGQDGRLAGDVRQGDGAQLLGRHRMRRAQPSTRRRSAGRSRSMRDGKPVTLHAAHLVFATGAYGPPRPIDLPGADGVQGRDPAFQPVFRRREIPRQDASSSSARPAPATTSPSTSGRPAPTSPWCSARRPRWSAPRR